MRPVCLIIAVEAVPLSVGRLEFGSEAALEADGAHRLGGAAVCSAGAHGKADGNWARQYTPPWRSSDVPQS